MPGKENLPGKILYEILNCSLGVSRLVSKHILCNYRIQFPFLHKTSQHTLILALNNIKMPGKENLPGKKCMKY